MDPQLNDQFPVKDPSQISPPFVGQPIHECAKVVSVSGFVPHARVRVYANGPMDVVGEDNPWIGSADIPLNRELKVGEVITATQTINGLEGFPSIKVIVQPAPTGLNKPTVGPDIFECGQIVDVSNLVTSVHVEVFETPALPSIETPATLVGQADTPASWKPVLTSPLIAGQFVTAEQISCLGQSDQLTSPPSDPVQVNPQPNPMPPPTMDLPIVGNDTVTVRNLLIGAEVTVTDTTVAQQIGGGWAIASALVFPLISSIQATDLYQAAQTLCTSSDPTEPQKPDTQLPPPFLRSPICAGTNTVTIANTVVNAVVNILVSGFPAPAGIGGAALGDVVIALGGGATFQAGDVITIVQYIGDVISPPSNAVQVISNLADDCMNM